MGVTSDMLLNIVPIIDWLSTSLVPNDGKIHQLWVIQGSLFQVAMAIVSAVVWGDANPFYEQEGNGKTTVGGGN